MSVQSDSLELLLTRRPSLRYERKSAACGKIPQGGEFTRSKPANLLCANIEGRSGCGEANSSKEQAYSLDCEQLSTCNYDGESSQKNHTRHAMPDSSTLENRASNTLCGQPVGHDHTIRETILENDNNDTPELLGQDGDAVHGYPYCPKRIDEEPVDRPTSAPLARKEFLEYLDGNWKRRSIAFSISKWPMTLRQHTASWVRESRPRERSRSRINGNHHPEQSQGDENHQSFTSSVSAISSSDDSESHIARPGSLSGRSQIKEEQIQSLFFDSLAKINFPTIPCFKGTDGGAIGITDAFHEALAIASTVASDQIFMHSNNESNQTININHISNIADFNDSAAPNSSLQDSIDALFRELKLITYNLSNNIVDPKPTLRRIRLTTLQLCSLQVVRLLISIRRQFCTEFPLGNFLNGRYFVSKHRRDGALSDSMEIVAKGRLTSTEKGIVSATTRRGRLNGAFRKWKLALLLSKYTQYCVMQRETLLNRLQVLLVMFKLRAYAYRRKSLRSKTTFFAVAHGRRLLRSTIESWRKITLASKDIAVKMRVADSISRQRLLERAFHGFLSYHKQCVVKRTLRDLTQALRNYLLLRKYIRIWRHGGLPRIQVVPRFQNDQSMDGRDEMKSIQRGDIESDSRMLRHFRRTILNCACVLQEAEILSSIPSITAVGVSHAFLRACSACTSMTESGRISLPLSSHPNSVSTDSLEIGPSPKTAEQDPLHSSIYHQLPFLRPTVQSIIKYSPTTHRGLSSSSSVARRDSEQASPPSFLEPLHPFYSCLLLRSTALSIAPIYDSICSCLDKLEPFEDSPAYSYNLLIVDGMNNPLLKLLNLALQCYLAEPNGWAKPFLKLLSQFFRFCNENSHLSSKELVSTFMGSYSDVILSHPEYGHTLSKHLVGAFEKSIQELTGTIPQVLKTDAAASATFQAISFSSNAPEIRCTSSTARLSPSLWKGSTSSAPMSIPRSPSTGYSRSSKDSTSSFVSHSELKEAFKIAFHSPSLDHSRYISHLTLSTMTPSPTAEDDEGDTSSIGATSLFSSHSESTISAPLSVLLPWLKHWQQWSLYRRMTHSMDDYWRHRRIRTAFNALVHYKTYQKHLAKEVETRYHQRLLRRIFDRWRSNARNNKAQRNSQATSFRRHWMQLSALRLLRKYAQNRLQYTMWNTQSAQIYLYNLKRSIFSQWKRIAEHNTPFRKAYNQVSSLCARNQVQTMLSRWQFRSQQRLFLRQALEKAERRSQDAIVAISAFEDSKFEHLQNAFYFWKQYTEEANEQRRVQILQLSAESFHAMTLKIRSFREWKRCILLCKAEKTVTNLRNRNLQRKALFLMRLIHTKRQAALYNVYYTHYIKLPVLRCLRLWRQRFAVRRLERYSRIRRAFLHWRECVTHDEVKKWAIEHYERNLLRKALRNWYTGIQRQKYCEDAILFLRNTSTKRFLRKLFLAWKFYANKDVNKIYEEREGYELAIVPGQRLIHHLSQPKRLSPDSESYVWIDVADPFHPLPPKKQQGSIATAPSESGEEVHVTRPLQLVSTAIVDRTSRIPKNRSERTESLLRAIAQSKEMKRMEMLRRSLPSATQSSYSNIQFVKRQRFTSRRRQHQQECESNVAPIIHPFVDTAGDSSHDSNTLATTIDRHVELQLNAILAQNKEISKKSFSHV